MTLGQRIRLRRRELGYTQHELAEKVGVAQPHISEIETGKTLDPRMKTLRHFARALGVGLEGIVGS